MNTYLRSGVCVFKGENQNLHVLAQDTIVDKPKWFLENLSESFEHWFSDI